MTTEKPEAARRPLVSVVMPAYNYGGFIGDALDSLRAQTYENWECVVVDDGSTDDTAAVVRAYSERDPRITCLRQQNQLQAAAKNLGLRHSSGEYIQYLDADDLIEPHKLERQVAYLEEHREVEIVYGGVRYFRSHRTEERLFTMSGGDAPWLPQVSGQGREVLAALVQNNIMVINSPLVRRSAAEEVGPFDVELPPVEDWDYWLRCAAAGKRFQFADLPGTLALVRSHPASSSRNQRRLRRSTLRLRKKINAIVKDEGLLELNRRWTAEYKEWVRHEEIREAVERAKEGDRVGGAWMLFGAGIKSRKARELGKLLFCAAAALAAPKTTLDTVVGAPAGRTLASILRYYRRGSV